MSELFDKQMNAQKEFEKVLPGFTQAPASPQKGCAMKMKETRKKQRAHKMLLMTGNHFISCIQRISEKGLNKLQINDSEDNKGTTYSFSKRLHGCQGDGFSSMVFQAWAHEQAPLNSQWLVLWIGGANFLRCWVADSVKTC